MAFNRPPQSPGAGGSSAPSGLPQSGAPAARSEPGAANAPGAPLPARILIVMADQWPRATLRAALREIGYDAIGTRSLSGALAYDAHALGRGPVRAIIVDATVLSPPPGAEGSSALDALVQRHGDVRLVLLASALRADPPGAWTRVLRRPFSIQDVVTAVSQVVPLPVESRSPIDRN